jgi:hypothetical protein
VLDCAAKTHGVSLNSLLRNGPNNLADLWGVLQRFRAHKHVIEGDITEMFSQVLVPPEDSKMLAFLWNNTPEEDPEVYINTRHIFGAKCSPAIAVNAVHFAVARMFPHLLQMVIRAFYMDDFFFGAATEEEVIAVTKLVTTALLASGFCLKKWASNSKNILNTFPKEDLAPPFRNISDKEGPLPTLKALGLRWDADQDTLGFSTRLVMEPPKNVAHALSQVASIFDLLRMAGPFLMKGKIIFQSFFHSGKSWLDPLEPHQTDLWMNWLCQIPRVAKLSIPRWFGFQPDVPVTLNMFSDASDKGYGTVGIFTGPNDH